VEWANDPAQTDKGDGYDDDERSRGKIKNVKQEDTYGMPALAKCHRTMLLLKIAHFTCSPNPSTGFI
jgi:hypothetical protein